MFNLFTCFVHVEIRLILWCVQLRVDFIPLYFCSIVMFRIISLDLKFFLAFHVIHFILNSFMNNKPTFFFGKCEFVLDGDFLKPNLACKTHCLGLPNYWTMDTGRLHHHWYLFFVGMGENNCAWSRKPMLHRETLKLADKKYKGDHTYRHI